MEIRDSKVLGKTFCRNCNRIVDIQFTFGEPAEELSEEKERTFKGILYGYQKCDCKLNGNVRFFATYDEKVFYICPNLKEEQEILLGEYESDFSYCDLCDDHGENYKSVDCICSENHKVILSRH